MREYRKHIEEVYKEISSYIKRTPILSSTYFSEKTDSSILFKCENFQYTNSFKVRGAFNKIVRMSDREGKIAIACSGGNHGLAVSFCGK